MNHCYVEIKGLPDERNLNNSILEYQGKRLMAYRAENQLTNEFAKLMICELKDNKPSNIKQIVVVPPQPHAHLFEDPRLFIHKGRLWMSFILATWMQGPHYACQGVALLDENFEIEKAFYPDFGDNCNHVCMGNHVLKREKNWMFFSHQNEIYFVYRINPLVIVKMDEETGECYLISSIKSDGEWEWGIPHGSALGVDRNGKRLGVFHSYKSTPEDGRQYVAGFFELNTDSWKVTRISKEPVLRAFRDESIDIRPMTQKYRPNAIFPCGLIETDEEVIVSYGWQDCRCMVALFERKEVEANMVEVKNHFLPREIAHKTIKWIKIK